MFDLRKNSRLEEESAEGRGTECQLIAGTLQLFPSIHNYWRCELTCQLSGSHRPDDKKALTPSGLKRESTAVHMWGLSNRCKRQLFPCDAPCGLTETRLGNRGRKLLKTNEIFMKKAGNAVHAGKAQHGAQRS